MKSFSRKELEEMKDDRYRARLINCLSGVKTPFLLGSQGQAGQTNLAVFSSLFHLGANPALMGLIVRPDVSPRHTLENFKDLGLITVNLLGTAYKRAIHHTSARFPKDHSEFVGCGLTEEYLGDCPAPFVKEAQVKWSLSWVRQIDIEENGTHMIIGAVENIHLPEGVVGDDGFLNLLEVDPCLVTGLDCYHELKGAQRYSYAKPDHIPQSLE